MRLWHVIAGPNILCISLSISVHEHASPLFFVVVWKGHCLSTNYYKNGVKSLNTTSIPRFVHVSIQVSELQKHGCPILMYGQKLFFVVFQNVYDNIYMPIPCVSPNSNTLTNFVCWSILVSEICIFNLKKKMIKNFSF